MEQALFASKLTHLLYGLWGHYFKQSNQILNNQFELYDVQYYNLALLIRLVEPLI